MTSFCSGGWPASPHAPHEAPGRTASRAAQRIGFSSSRQRAAASRLGSGTGAAATYWPPRPGWRHRRGRRKWYRRRRWCPPLPRARRHRAHWRPGWPSPAGSSAPADCRRDDRVDPFGQQPVELGRRMAGLDLVGHDVADRPVALQLDRAQLEQVAADRRLGGRRCPPATAGRPAPPGCRPRCSRSQSAIIRWR